MADDLKPSGASLYERDFYAWTRTQAQALRASRADDDALDYNNLAEEIEDVGSERLFACESDMERIVEHLLKIQLVRSPRDIPHWKGEIDQFRRHMAKRLTRTIRNEIEPLAEGAYADALKRLARLDLIALDEPLVAATSPFAWAQIVDEAFFTAPLYDAEG